MEETLTTNTVLYIVASLLSFTMSTAMTIQWLTHRSLKCLKSWSFAYILQTLSTIIYISNILNSHPHPIVTECMVILAIMSNILFWRGAVEFKGGASPPILTIYIISLYIAVSSISYYFFNGPLPSETVTLLAYTLSELLTGLQLLKPSAYKITSTKVIALLLLLEASQTIMIVILSAIFHTEINTSTESLAITFLIIESCLLTVVFTYGCICMTNKLLIMKAIDNNKALQINHTHSTHNESITLRSILTTPNHIVQKFTSVFLIKINKRSPDISKALLKSLRASLRKQDLIAIHRNNSILGVMKNTNTEEVERSINRSLVKLRKSIPSYEESDIHIGIANSPNPETVDHLTLKATQAVDICITHHKLFHGFTL